MSHPVVPIQQVFHRENQKIWTVLPVFFRGLFTELNNPGGNHGGASSMKEYNDLKQRLMKIGIKNLIYI